VTQKEKICVVGLGYVGLPTAALFATHGYEVVGVDIDHGVVGLVNGAGVHGREPGLRTLVRAAVKSQHLSAQVFPEEADVFIIAVPTPSTADKRADLSAVIAATEAVVPCLRSGDMIILESTVPPGTTAAVVVPIVERSGLKAGRDLHIVHAPERVLPGRILIELVQNDRVIGGIDRVSAERARDLYRRFVTGQIYLTDATTAELVKLMENTYRDVNIALANSFAKIGDLLGLDIWDAIELANRHPRVSILRPGPGVGGHCVAVDPWFIVEKASPESQLITTARMINDSMPTYVARSILGLLNGLPDPQVAVLGAAYKANVDDTRGSPALRIVELLAEQGCHVRVHDPHVYPNVDLMDAVQGTDCLALLVNHQEYTELNPWTLGEVMRHRVAFDAQNHLPYNLWQAAGFQVKKLGHGRDSSEESIANWMRWSERTAFQER